MTQQNQTEQPGAAEPDRPEQPGGPRQPATTEHPGVSQQPGPPQQPGTPQQPLIPQAPTRQQPSLYGYEALPEAYLAPPQPGQPRYGTPRQPGNGRPYAARPGSGQPGNGQSAAGQAGYGRPAPARPSLGAAARRDPALAAPWQRLVAQAIDWTIIFAISVLAFWSPLYRVFRQLQAVSSTFSDRTSPAAMAAINSVERNPDNQHAVLYWLLATMGIALVYFWLQHAAWGATVGKRAMGMRVVRAGDRSRLGVLAAGIRAAAFLAGPAIFLLVVPPFSLVGGVLWAADAGLPLVDLKAQSLHDKLAGSVVVRQSALDESARRPSPW